MPMAPGEGIESRGKRDSPAPRGRRSDPRSAFILTRLAWKSKIKITKYIYGTWNFIEIGFAHNLRISERGSYSSIAFESVH